MTGLPSSIEDMTARAIAATAAALDAGNTRVIVDLRLPELKPLPVAREFARLFGDRYGEAWQALFADAGAAALAKQEWEGLSVSMRGVNEGRAAISSEDRAFLLVAPTSVELDRVEKLLELAGDRPFVMVNPRLENAEVGLGLAARRMRERFLSRFEVVFFFQLLPEGAILREFPHLWEVWRETEGEVEKIAEGHARPVGDDLDRLFAKAAGKRPPLLAAMQRFINALGR